MSHFPSPVFPNSTSSYPERSLSFTDSSLNSAFSAFSLAESSSPSIESPCSISYLSSHGAPSSPVSPSTDSSRCYGLPSEQSSVHPNSSGHRPTPTHTDTQPTPEKPSSISSRKYAGSTPFGRPKSPKRKQRSDSPAQQEQEEQTEEQKEQEENLANADAQKRKRKSSKRRKRSYSPSPEPERFDPPAPDHCEHCFKHLKHVNIARHKKNSCPALPKHRRILCDLCGKDFSRKDACTRHRNKRHKKPPSDPPTAPLPEAASSVAPSAPFTFRAPPSSSTHATPNWHQDPTLSRPAIVSQDNPHLGNPLIDSPIFVRLPSGQDVPVGVVAGHELRTALNVNVASGQQFVGFFVEMDNAGPYHPSMLPQPPFEQHADKHYASVTHQSPTTISPAQEVGVEHPLPDRTTMQEGWRTESESNLDWTEEPGGFVGMPPMSNSPSEAGQDTPAPDTPETYFYTQLPFDLNSTGEWQEEANTDFSMANSFYDSVDLSLTSSVDPFSLNDFEAQQGGDDDSISIPSDILVPFLNEFDTDGQFSAPY